ncbi:MAG: hypothetical protein WCX65_16680 [bacterium]
MFDVRYSINIVMISITQHNKAVSSHRTPKRYAQKTVEGRKQKVEREKRKNSKKQTANSKKQKAKKRKPAAKGTKKRRAVRARLLGCLSGMFEGSAYSGASGSSI